MLHSVFTIKNIDSRRLASELIRLENESTNFYGLGLKDDYRSFVAFVIKYKESLVLYYSICDGGTYMIKYNNDLEQVHHNIVDNETLKIKLANLNQFN
jgi:hypothetical protein